MKEKENSRAFAEEHLAQWALPSAFPHPTPIPAVFCHLPNPPAPVPPFAGPALFLYPRVQRGRSARCPRSACRTRTDEACLSRWPP